MHATEVRHYLDPGDLRDAGVRPRRPWGAAAQISPWIDAELDPLDEYLRIVDAQPNRRFLKTHTPFDGIPFDPSCTYLVVLRDPRDVYFSGSDHRDNMTNRELASTFPSGENAFEIWLQDACAPGEWDRWTLDTLVRFFRSYWDYRELPNVHLFHYSDMKRDLPAVIGAMSKALGYDYTDTTIEDFAAAATFDTMKQNAERFAPQAGVGFWKSDNDFFARGRHREWENRWSQAEHDAFAARIGSMLDEPAARWLLDGAG